VIGAGHVGAMTALRLAETSLISRVVLVDVVPGLAAGLALDMWHSASVRGFKTRIEGGVDMSAIGGAEYVVVNAGKPRLPGMSRTDLTRVNAEIIKQVAAEIRVHAPRSVVVVVTMERSQPSFGFLFHLRSFDELRPVQSAQRLSDSSQPTLCTGSPLQE
jgi:malate dehydrogenase